MKVTTKLTPKAIFDKYGESVFRMGISHLMDVGAQHLDNETVEKACDFLTKITPQNSMMAGVFASNIIKCAAELSKCNIAEVLAFTQTHVIFTEYEKHLECPNCGAEYSDDSYWKYDHIMGGENGVNRVGFVHRCSKCGHLDVRHYVMIPVGE